MGRINGSYNLGSTFNISAQYPIDSRMRVQYVDDLTNTTTWEIDGFTKRVYSGMLVVVMYKGDSTDKGTDPCGDVWVLPDMNKYTVFDDGTPSNTGGWKLVSLKISGDDL